MRWQGRLAEGGSSDVCLNTADVMPTLLSLMGLPVPAEAEGASVKAAVLGEPGAAEPEGALMMGTGATAVFEDGHEWRAFRTKRHTYAAYLADRSELLFDNQADPLQMQNLAADSAYGALKHDLREKMLAKMREIGDGFAAASWYERQPAASSLPQAANWQAFAGGP